MPLRVALSKGHACGHNLICVAGIAAFLGLREAMMKHDIPGTLVLLGTPGGQGIFAAAYHQRKKAVVASSSCSRPGHVRVLVHREHD